VEIVPHWIANRTSANEHTLRILMAILTMFCTSGVFKMLQNVWLESYNELLEKDVYDIQQSLKNNGRIDIDDLDWSIRILQSIKDAIPPTTNNPTEEKPKKDE
jgi:hypothetical protein